jgi:hypothetical protein
MTQSKDGLNFIYSKMHLSAVTEEKPLEDATSAFVDSNEQLLRDNEVLKTIENFLKAKLFSKGLLFLVEGEWMVPSGEFAAIVQHHWLPFLCKALRFIMARGFLVWFIVRTPKGYAIPDVPDISQLNYKFVRDWNTGQTRLDVRWVEAQLHDIILYTFNNESTFGITPEEPNSMIDSAKNLIRMLQVSAMNEEIACHNNARAPIMIEMPMRTGTNNTDSKTVTLDELLGRGWAEKTIAMGNDDLAVGRVRRMQQMNVYNNNNSDVLGGENGGRAMPCWKRAQVASDIKPAGRFVIPPYGMTYRGTVTVQGDPNWMKKRQMLVEEVYNLFGIPYSALMTSTAQISSTGIDLHKTMLLNTLEMWWVTFSILLTDVYRLLHDPLSLMVANTQPTFEQDNSKMISEEKLRTRDILKSINSDNIRKNFRPRGDKSAVREDGRESNNIRYSVTVELTSRFSTTPEQAYALYHDGTVSFQDSQRLRLQSVGLPTSMADAKCPPPMRVMARTLEEELLLGASTEKADGGGGGSGGGAPSAKKRKIEPADITLTLTQA